jgi:sortase family protein
MPAYARAGVLAVLVLALVAGERLPAPAEEVAAPVRAPIRADKFKSVRTYDEVAVPVRLRIRSLHVDGTVQKLGRQPDGEIEVPQRTDVAGWYEYGPRPGRPGPAVILGHVDSQSGPGIFIDLSTVRPGALIGVDRADGSTVTFRVSKVSRVPKTVFPTDLVYAPSLDPTLRLVTCGGSFDRTRGSYRDNVIVFADQA